MNRRLSCLAAALALVSVIAAPAFAETIGVSVARADSVFLTILRQGMEKRAGEIEGARLQVEGAQNDPQRQLDQVRNFIAAKVDAIVVAAVDGDIWVPFELVTPANMGAYAKAK